MLQFLLSYFTTFHYISNQQIYFEEREETKKEKGMIFVVMKEGRRGVEGERRDEERREREKREREKSWRHFI